jgi:biopolymer transport protein ExbD
MAHAGGGHGGSGHPDLTPMLDLVMQLLMYFIMCANFLGVQVNREISLPDSQSARPLDRREGDVLFVNVNAQGQILVLGQEPMGISDYDYWLSKRATEAPKDKDGKITTVIVLRGDKAADYSIIYQTLQTSRKRGFRYFNTRLNILG